jgi:ech hydrogenase subunit C
MRGLKESPWIIHYDASSCNGCDIEALACLAPLFDVERLGVINTGNPKHADIFLVTGAVNEQCRAVICNIYRQMPEPKVVVAVGACAATGGIFRECYNISGGVDGVVPVDVYVPGCAARPEAIIDGVVKALAVLEEKQKAVKLAASVVDQVIYARAAKSDAAEILVLRKVAWQAEAGAYGDESFPELSRSLEELEKEFEQRFFVKAVVNGKLIGCCSGCQERETVHLSAICLHPYFRDSEVAERLERELEDCFPHARRFETVSGDKSEKRLWQLGQWGFRSFRTEMFTPKITWIYLQKERA